MAKRKFGITTNNINGIGGIVVNNLTIDHKTEVAEARNSVGRIIDLATYSLEDQITINGMYQNELIRPGSVISIDQTSYIVTNSTLTEENRAFQTASLIAVNYPQFVPPIPPPTPVTGSPLTFIALEDGAGLELLRGVDEYGDPVEYEFKAVQYKINNGNWMTYTFNTPIAMNSGDKVSFQSNTVNSLNHYRFNTYRTFDLQGNIQSLNNYQDIPTYQENGQTIKVKDYYNSLFRYIKVVDASRLYLPDMDLGETCYEYMFSECSSLIAVPALPATGLAKECYKDMFGACESLVAVPKNYLSAGTDLEQGCYKSMFNWCYNLTGLPDLPSLYLESYCYANMFEGLTGLTKVPIDLPATTLAPWCYYNMFRNCWSLTSAPVLSATSLATACYYEMFYGCSSLIVAPELPATTLKQSCYDGMFEGCKSLTEAPVLSATTLANDCYWHMFTNCSSLSSINVSFTNWGVNTNTYYWVSGVPSTGIFYKPAELSTIIANSSNYYSKIPSGWTVINKDQPQPEPSAVPLTFTGLSSTNAIRLQAHGSPDPIVLKAKINDGDWNSVTVDQNTYYTARLNQGDTIAFSGANDHFSTQGGNYYTFAMTGQIAASGNTMSLMNYSLSCTPYCFFKLFDGCTNLTDAPELPATTLADACYHVMFGGNYNLTAVPTLPATTLAPSCYMDMFAYCLKLKNVPSDYLPATTLTQSCYDSMFMNCDMLTAAPALPASTLTTYCYQMMFQNCSRLSSISVNFTDWSEANYATQHWTYGVQNDNGTFYKPAALSTVYGSHYIPEGWYVVEEQVEEPEPEDPPPSVQV